MTNINLCRVCLASSIKVHHIVNTHYKGTFEKLADKKLTTEDGRPTTICFICLAHLRKCRQFMDMSAKAEEILTQFYQSGIELNSETVNILDRRSVHNLLWTPLQIISLKGAEETKSVKVEIKSEPLEETFEDVNCPVKNVTCPNEDVICPTENVTCPIDNLACPIQNDYNTIEYETRPSGNVTRPFGNINCPIDNVNIAKKAKIITKQETVEDVSNRKIIKKTLDLNHVTVNEIIIKQEIDENVNQTENESVATENESVATENESVVNVVKQEMAEYVTGTIEISEDVNKTKDIIEMDVTESVKEEIESEYDELEAEFEITDVTAEKISNMDKPNENTDRNPTVHGKKHQCPACEKSYVHRYHLLRHIKSHMPEPPKPKQRLQRPGKIYPCNKCDKTFLCKINLKKHRTLHSKKYSCDLCPTKCREKHDFLIHMRIHTGEKPFTCDICNMSFSRKNNMRAHIEQTHTEDKKFVCHICKENFSRNYDLNRHIKRKHTNEKPFACDICDFRSVNAHYIKVHIENKHTGRKDKPYACEICHFRSVSANYIKKHIESKHGVVKKAEFETT